MNKYSEHEAREAQYRPFVERSLGDSVICRNCGATLGTYAEICTADLQEQCPGFLAIEKSKEDFLSAAQQPVPEVKP